MCKPLIPSGFASFLTCSCCSDICCGYMVDIKGTEMLVGGSLFIAGGIVVVSVVELKLFVT